MNRTRRKALKMLKRKYGRATNPHWQAEPNTDRLGAAIDDALDAIAATMRETYDRATRAGHGPQMVSSDGSVLNCLSGRTDFVPGQLYDVWVD